MTISESRIRDLLGLDDLDRAAQWERVRTGPPVVFTICKEHQNIHPGRKVVFIEKRKRPWPKKSR